MSINEKATITKEQIERLHKDYETIVNGADVHQLAQLVIDADKAVKRFREALKNKPGSIEECAVQITCQIFRGPGCPGVDPVCTVETFDLKSVLEDSWVVNVILANNYLAKSPENIR